MSQIDEIKSRIDIVDLIGETVKLRRAGKNYSGLCPFHNEKTPSFIVSPDRQSWRCFGQCGEGGDIIKFVMKKEGWDFKEALRSLADRAGVKLEPFRAERQEEKEAHERLRGLLEDAAVYYRHQLTTPAGKFALDYLHEKRHISDETIEAFGLGYAPAGWDAALNHFKTRAYTEKELLEAGLVSERENGGFYDKFRNRLMIPIRDENGKMTGFGGRILDPQDVPKFMNSPETPLFSKSRLLYGLDRARKSIRAENQAVIVEGYLDVIAVQQAGFMNVVSPMGTALTEDQLRLLKKFTRRIVLALDPDAAGQKAVLRGLEAARQSLDRTNEIAFDARRLLQHEARLQADLRVANMPDGLDPDEIVQRDPEQWNSLINNAQPIVVHVMETLAQDRDLEDAKVKVDISSQVLPLIEDLPNPEERDTYKQRLARLLNLDELTFLRTRTGGIKTNTTRDQKKWGSGGKQTPPVGQKEPGRETGAKVLSSAQRVEAHILGLLLQRTDLLFQLDRRLQEAGLAHLGPEDFSHTDHQVLFRLVRRSLEQDDYEAGMYLVKNLPESLNDLAAGLRSQAGTGATLDDRLLEDLFRAAIMIRRLSLDDSINQIHFLVLEAQQTGDSDGVLSYKEMVQNLKQSRLKLDQAPRVQDVNARGNK